MSVKEKILAKEKLAFPGTINFAVNFCFPLCRKQSLWPPYCGSVIRCVQLFATPWTAALQASLSFTISCSLLKLMSIESVMPSNHPILCHPCSSCLQSFPVSESFPVSRFFASGDQSIGASASTSVLPMNVQDWFPLGLVGSPCCPRDFQESSPTPQFKNINSSALSFLYGSTLTSICDYWMNHSFD